MLFDKSFRMKKEARRALLIALLYLISPIDLIPDWLPFVGRLDDLFVLAVAGKIASEEIARYKLHLATAKQELKPEKA
ncbi:MAG: DUF1232 domain-containing protein [Deinococcus sp.]|nr:DUF1232 domain-containing protein [Deinococcus sp.]